MAIDPRISRYDLDKFVEECKEAGMVVIDSKTIAEDERKSRIDAMSFISKMKALQDSSCIMQGEKAWMLNS